jgi:hypothetical protein
MVALFFHKQLKSYSTRMLNYSATLVFDQEKIIYKIVDVLLLSYEYFSVRLLKASEEKDVHQLPHIKSV